MYKNILFFLLLAVFFSCNAGSSSSGGGGGNGGSSGDGTSSSSSSSSSSSGVNIEVTYTQGTANFSYPIVYVIWIENQSGDNIQNLYVCERLVGGGAGGLHGTALPYWKTHKYPGTEIDGVTGATETGDFTLNSILSDASIRKFKIYMEVDHSYDGNDWFNDQPALIYSTPEIDLDNLQPQYSFNPIGWVRNENTGSLSNFIKPVTGHSSPDFADLTTDIRYVRYHTDSSTTPYGFGSEYMDNTPATCLVGTLIAKITIN
jgi:hypothetical protein